MTELYGRGVYRFLLSRQWVILTLIMLALIPTMIELGFWQLHRHEHKVALNKVISDSLSAKPVPAESLTAPGKAIERDNLYRRVTARAPSTPRTRSSSAAAPTPTKRSATTC